MLDVEAAQRLKRGRQVLGLEYIDARVVQRRESSNRWAVREDDGWRLLRGSDKRGVEGSLGVSIEDDAHWRHSRTDGSSRRQLWIVGAHGSQPDRDRIHIRAQALHFLPRELIADPASLARRVVHLPVAREREL